MKRLILPLIFTLGLTTNAIAGPPRSAPLSMIPSALPATNSPSDDQVATYDAASGGWTWVANGVGVAEVVDEVVSTINFDGDTTEAASRTSLYNSGRSYGSAGETAGEVLASATFLSISFNN